VRVNSPSTRGMEKGVKSNKNEFVCRPSESGKGTTLSFHRFFTGVKIEWRRRTHGFDMKEQGKRKKKESRRENKWQRIGSFSECRQNQIRAPRRKASSTTKKRVKMGGEDLLYERSPTHRFRRIRRIGEMTRLSGVYRIDSDKRSGPLLRAKEVIPDS